MAYRKERLAARPGPCAAARAQLAARRRSRARRLVFFAIAPALLVALRAGAAGLHGRLLLTELAEHSAHDSLEAVLGPRTRTDFLGDARLTWEPKWSDWDLALAYEVAGVAGRGVMAARGEGGVLPAAPPATLFDLGDVPIDRPRAVVTEKIDRLAVGHSSAHLVVRVGRQALTWGAGTVFHPMDLVDPFAPEAIDTEYKPGVDMAYVQRLFDDGSDLQLIAVPRGTESGGPAKRDASTFAVHYRRSFASLGATWMFARDRGDWTAALALSGPWRGAVWNVEIVPTFETHGRTAVSALANISAAVTLSGRNALVFGEYYRNGFGAIRTGTPYASLPADLLARLARGQLYNVSRDYAAAGMRLEWTALLNLTPSAIVNLDDRSFYLAVQAVRSLSDNADLVAGAQAPFGGAHTEYGGLPAQGGGAPYVAPSVLVYVQFRRHF